MPRAVFLNSRGVVAVIDDAPGGGLASDASAPRNRPAVDPGSWLANVHFQSDCDQYQQAAAVQTVSVTHTSLAGATSSTTFAVDGSAIVTNGQERDLDILLYAHGQGYRPPYMISYLGARLPSGTCVQTQGSGGTSRSRTVSHWADATGVYLHEHATSAAAALDAITLTYEIRVFAIPAADPAAKLASYLNSTGVVQLGKGKVPSNKRYLRAVLSGESSFDINLGATMDVVGGRVRAVTGGVAYDDPSYAGSFAGPAFVPVGGVF